MEALCPSGRALDFELDFELFEPLNCEVLGLKPALGTVVCPRAKHIYSLKYWLILRKWWLHPEMTDELLTGTFNIKQKL